MSDPLTIVLYGALMAAASASLLAGVRLLDRLDGKTVGIVAALVFSVYGSLLWFQPGAVLATNLSVLAAAVVGGRIIALPLRSRAALVTFAVTASMVDLFSFSGGLTARIIDSYQQGESRLLLYLCLSIPISGRLVPVIGIGDLLVSAAIMAAMAETGESSLSAWLVVTSGLLAALLVGLWLGGIFAIPFIAAALLSYGLLRPRRP